MQYVSTRGRAAPLNFTDCLLAGLAPDGGLYLPAQWPELSHAEWQTMANLSYQELAFAVTQRFVGDTIAQSDLREIVTRSYAGFRHQAIAPLKQLDGNLFLLELFHGPTLAFKDFALQLLGNLFAHVLERDDRALTIVGATSGDTGSAAIAAIADKPRLQIFMLHPKGLVSNVQEAQMTSVTADNVRNLAIAGSFDDCQDIVKSLFHDEAFRDEVKLSAVNSINWARIMAQIVYYAYAALRLGAPHREIAVAVPSGNFGNIFAAWGARKMGLPIKRLIIGSNRNDILARAVHQGIMQTETVIPTCAPSMDIQISSNFERLLFELLERDSERLSAMMRDFRDKGGLAFPESVTQGLQGLFGALALDDEAIADEIKYYHGKTGEVLDPHSAIGVAAARQLGDDMPVIAAATAHPAKFPETIIKAIGHCPALPAHLADLLDRPKRCETLGNDAESVKSFIRQNRSAR